MKAHRFGGMAYCKDTGKPLPLNLYSDSKGRPGIYRYRREDGTYKTFRAPYSKAVAAAKKENAKRNAPDGSLVYWVQQYRNWQIERDVSLESKRGWRDRQRQLERFANDWNHLKPHQLTVPVLSDWWDNLTYDQQHNRRSHFSAFFVWGLGKGISRENPFSKYDNVRKLIEKKKPEKQRSILALDEFWQVYEYATDTVQVGMLISLVTTMREGDIVALRLDKHVVDGKLQTTIQKSLNQRGASAASHLEWSLDEHAQLKLAIDRGREMSMRHMRCPYVVSRKRQRPSQRLRIGHTHAHQCTPDVLSRGFAAARDATGIWESDGPTFHEIRGLSITLLLNQGHDVSAVQRLAAHTDPAITKGYPAGQRPHYLNMAGLVVPVEI